VWAREKVWATRSQGSGLLRTFSRDQKVRATWATRSRGEQFLELYYVLSNRAATTDCVFKLSSYLVFCFVSLSYGNRNVSPKPAVLESSLATAPAVVVGHDGTLTPTSNVTPSSVNAERAQVITLLPLGVTFEIANPMTGHTYAGAKLEDLRVCKNNTEWDKEFAEAINGILPFEALVVGVSSDPFCTGVGYFDSHVRAYVFDAPIDDVMRTIQTKGPVQAQHFGYNAALLDPRMEPPTDVVGTRRFTITYPRFYHDYGADARIDFFAKSFGAQTVVIALLGTKTGVYFTNKVRVDPHGDIIRSLRKN
jgi:hypothetical protein